MRQGFLIVDNEFNRMWYPDLIGQTLPVAPSYASVLPVEVPEEAAPIDNRTLDEVVFG